MEYFEKLGKELGQLVDEKQAAYGDSFGKSERVFKLLYPDGIKPEQYKDALAVVRIVDKLFRIATKKDAFGESPFKDVAGYGLLGCRDTIEPENELGKIEEKTIEPKLLLRAEYRPELGDDVRCSKHDTCEHLTCHHGSIHKYDPLYCDKTTASDCPDCIPCSE